MKNHTPYAIRHTLIIGWLYPELMNTYGDRGNIITLQKRCAWRNIDCKVKHLNPGFNINELKKCDLLFMGGAQDKQQKIVADDFNQAKIKALKEAIENEIPGLFICGAYQFLGKYYKEADGITIDCLNLIDFYTENPGSKYKRLIGNVVVKIEDLRFTIYDLKDIKNKKNHKSYFINHQSQILVGFENHGGRTYLGKEIKPLGDVLVGFGNNGEDGKEGMVYKNIFGTYLHGPLLPKNPQFADLLIKIALEKKYQTEVKLKPLDDTLEWKAHYAIAKKLNLKL